MRSIGIGELQKNTSIFKNLTEAVQIVDKRKKINLAMVYPVHTQSVISGLAGKYQSRVVKSDLSMSDIKDQSMTLAMKDKYDLPS
mgnify:FL=1|jgi:hypothetical protein